jgi:hypothetical protein
MNAPWKLICLVLALLLFGIAAWSASWTVPSPNSPVLWWGRFVAAGLFFATLSFIIS